MSANKSGTMHTRGAKRRCSYDTLPGGAGVLVGDDPRATIGAPTPPAERLMLGFAISRVKPRSESPEP
ncbi:MAG TPA: hypothetical protein VGO75_08680 [Gemmatimonadaceae bacterium]|nr:hypothetical protein [Gemmatimonadaceae bacterium]